MVNLQKFKTLLELPAYFKEEQLCRDYLELLRWPDGIKCAYKDCGHDKVFSFSNGKVYKCAKCKKQFSVKVGTIFEDSKIPLQKWYAAIYLITSHKKRNFIYSVGQRYWRYSKDSVVHEPPCKALPGLGYSRRKIKRNCGSG